MLYSICYHLHMSAKYDAIKLRKEGYSYSYIAEKTGLSKSTLSNHLAKLPYTPNEHTQRKATNAQLSSARTKHAQKRASLDLAAASARKDIGCMSERDLFIVGLGLYIGEGSKTQGLVRLVNTDPRVIRLFIRWVRALGLSDGNIAIRIHLYPDSDVHSANVYWLKETSLPKASLQSACIDRRVRKDRKRNSTHMYGTAHITVRANGEKKFGVFLSRRIAAAMDEVLEL